MLQRCSVGISAVMPTILTELPQGFPESLQAYAKEVLEIRP
jgi:hypothetical protein